MAVSTGNNDSILRIGAPRLEELPGQARLHHTGRGHDHARAYVLEMVYALELHNKILFKVNIFLYYLRYDSRNLICVCFQWMSVLIGQSAMLTVLYKAR